MFNINKPLMCASLPFLLGVLFFEKVLLYTDPQRSNILPFRFGHLFPCLLDTHIATRESLTWQDRPHFPGNDCGWFMMLLSLPQFIYILTSNLLKSVITSTCETLCLITNQYVGHFYFFVSIPYSNKTMSIFNISVVCSRVRPSSLRRFSVELVQILRVLKTVCFVSLALMLLHERAFSRFVIFDKLSKTACDECGCWIFLAYWFHSRPQFQQLCYHWKRPNMVTTIVDHVISGQLGLPIITPQK